MRTLRNLQHVDVGYRSDKLLLVDIDGMESGRKESELGPMFARLQDEIRSLPGVTGVTYSQNGLFGGSDSGTRLYVDGYTPPEGKSTGTRFDQVGANYFSTLGIPILRGREIDHRDTANSTPVCVINQAMAKDFFEGRDPLGKHIRDLFPGSTAPPCEIIGVTGNARDHELRGDTRRRFYAAATQGVGELPTFVSFEIRTAGEPGTVVARCGTASAASTRISRCPIRRP